MRNHHPVLPAVDLALQGGGSHGAFTWGVLDRLLEPDGLSFAAISGTSAGALNAAVLVSGFHTGGRDGARAALTEFWHDVSGSGTIFSPYTLAHASAAQDSYNFDKLPGYQWMNSFFRAFSPYEFNPLNLNPLRDVLKRHVDVQALHACSLNLFVTAWRDALVLPGLTTPVARAYLLADGSRTPLSAEPVAAGVRIALPASMPDPVCSVIVCEFDRPPEVRSS